MLATSSSGEIRFADFEVNLRSGELHRHGLRVKLQIQPFQVLCALLERAGEVISREELQKRIWPADTFVDFDQGLNNAVKKLREALGDNAAKNLASSRLFQNGVIASSVNCTKGQTPWAALAHLPKALLLIPLRCCLSQA